MLKMFPGHSVTTWIPIYKTALKPEELLAIWQTVKQLSGTTRCVLAGKMSDIRFLRNLQYALGAGEIFLLPDSVFKSVKSYCNLLLSPEFYQLFETTHVLVAQLDAWICKSSISQFLKYDYVAPRFYPYPHRDSLADTRCIGVGVGGLSLRNCKAHSHALRKGFRFYENNIYKKKMRSYNMNGKISLACKVAMARLQNSSAAFPSASTDLTALGVNEDWILGIYCFNRMKVAPRSAAQSFGIDGYFLDQLNELGPNIPFGLHGWYRSREAIEQCRQLIVSTIRPGWEEFLVLNGSTCSAEKSATLLELFPEY